MALTDWYCEEVLPGKLEIDRVYEDDRVLAFHHPRPSSEIHVVVIPKSHVPSLLHESAVDGSLLESMLRAIQHAASTLHLDDGRGFYVRANAAAIGVTPHMHWHILAPGAGADWPTPSDEPMRSQS
jgi:histidine triad (HIT) family protein